MAVIKKLELNSEQHRHQVLITAANMFLTQGYTATTLRQLAKEAGINIGSLMHLFENKENILCALVCMVMDGQFNAISAMLKDKTDDRILFWAAETVLQLYMAESNEQLRDLYITSYTLPKTSELIRKNISKKMGEFFLPYNPGYEQKDFYELEIATGGIIRGYMSVPCDIYFTMETKIARYLETSFRVYRVPEEKAAEAIAFVSQFDFTQIAQNVINSMLVTMTTIPEKEK